MPSGSKIAYEQYAPHLYIKPKKDFILLDMGWEKIVSKPLSHYLNLSVDYIIVTSFFKERFYNEPDKYVEEISRYEELKDKATIIKIFDNKENPGPVIEIYKIRMEPHGLIPVPALRSAELSITALRHAGVVP